MKCLVSCPRRLLLVDLQTREVGVVEAGRPEYYGISWTPDGRQLCLTHSDLDNAALGTMESYLDAEQGCLSLGGRLGPRCLAAPHQVLCLDSHTVATNTGRNCLTVFNPADLFYQNCWLDDVRWDRKGRAKDCGSHFNSLYYRDGRLFVLAHNFDRGSYILVLSWPNLEIIERIATKARHGHNVWPWPGGEIVVCDSAAGAVVEARSGQVLWRTEGMLARGLACHGNVVLIGGSALAEPAQRPRADGRIWIVDRTSWKQIDDIPLPGAGVVHDIRILDREDECHHGRPLRQLPAVDIAATEAYHRQIKSPRSHAPRGNALLQPLRGAVEQPGPAADSPQSGLDSAFPRGAWEREGEHIRIGIWPDHGYGVLPERNDTQFVFPLTADFDGLVPPLTRSLLEADDRVEVVVLDRRQYRALRTSVAGDRLVHPVRWTAAIQPLAFWFIEGWLALTDFSRRGCQLPQTLRQRAVYGLQGLGREIRRGNVALLLIGLLVGPLLFLLAWLTALLHHLLMGLFCGLLFPVHVWHRLLLRGRDEIRQAAVRRARAAACDAWLVPAVRRGSPPDWVHHVEWGRSAEKLLLPAALTDWPKLGSDHLLRLRPAAQSRPYLLLPVAAQPGPFLDNMRRALDLLDTPSLDLVFTAAGGPLPVDPRVHVWRTADLHTRAAACHGAVATVLPCLCPDTLTVIATALHWGCPLIAAGAPALLPLVRYFGDALALFDPAYPASFARAVEQTREDRDWHHALQQEAARALWQRDWDAVAADLLRIVRPAGPAYRPGSRSDFQTASGR